MYSFIIFFASLFLLYKTSEWVIRYGLELSRMLGISTFAIGFILISVSTSLPEFMVSIFSSLGGNTGLTIGNVFGANLMDLTVVLGIVAIIGSSIAIGKEDSKNLLELLFVSIVVSFLIFIGGSLTVFHGILLLALFTFFIRRLYKGGRIKEEVFGGKKRNKHELGAVLLKTCLSLIVLVISARLLVGSSVEIAGFLGLATTFIGATMVSWGTTLPELSVEIRAIKKRQYGLAMGDLFGSLLSNLTLVLGTAALLGPARLDALSIAGIMPFLFMATAIVWYSVRVNGRIRRYDGVILLLIYAVFLFQETALAVFFG